MRKVLFLLILSSITLSSSASFTKKIWVAEKISLQLNDQFILKSEFAQRWQNTTDGQPAAGGINEWEECFAELGIDYKINDRWVANFTYRHIESKIKTPLYDVENRFFGAIEYKFKLWGMHWGLRTRLATRLFDSSKTKYRFTETFRFDIPIGVKINSRAIKYFFYDEVHVDLNKGGFNNNEIRTGLNLPITSNLGIDLYYGNEYRKRFTNGDYNIHNLIGLEVGYKF